MSRAEEFVSAVRADPELEARLSAASSSEEAKKIVTDAGYGDVSSADVKALSESDELSDAELAAASGAGGIGLFGGGFGSPHYAGPPPPFFGSW
jgi:predicted ribosomally synthesized peptide with nif11-like leader